MHCSDDGSVSTRQQAVIWTHDGQFTDAYLRRALGLNELTSHDDNMTWEHIPIYCLFVWGTHPRNGVQHTNELPVIWYALTLMWLHCTWLAACNWAVKAIMACIKWES